MQFQKEDIKNNILIAAKKEFLINGFENASVRTIAAGARTSKSNIYNYFKDKDELFCAILKPALLKIDTGMRNIRDKNESRSVKTYTMDAQKEMIGAIMKFVFENSVDFKLLLFCSAGSSLADFKSRLAGALSGVLINWVAAVAPQNNISDFFISSVAGFYINVMEQLLIENKTKEEAAEYFKEYLAFIYGGWKSILQS